MNSGYNVLEVVGTEPKRNGCNRIRWAMSSMAVKLGLFAFVAISAGVARGSDATAVGEVLDLDGTWQATLDPENRGETQHWFEEEFKGEGWRQVHVPGSFADVAPEIDRYEGLGWFRRSFGVPRQWQGRHVVLHFEGVNNQCKVWVNGQPVGENLDAFLGFELPVGAQIRFGENNVFAVRADNTRRRDMIPGGRQGWHPFGGILREVQLRAGDRFRVEAIRIAAGPDGSLRLKATVANDANESRTGWLEVTIRDEKGAVCAEFALSPIEVNTGRRETFETDKQISGVRAWSPAQPALYTADIRLVSEGKAVDETSARFGFRRIEARGERLYLNGEPVFLTGFNRHEDSPRTDMCPDHELTRKELMQMKEMGCNFIRLCHYPQHPKTVDLCDEVGLLVMCEIPLYMWPGLEEGVENYRGTVESARRQLTKMIERYYNHPSVVFWSVSNEIHTQHPEVRGTNVVLIQQARRLDPTRLAVHVSDHWQQGSPRADSFGEDDVICLNGYPHPREGPAWWRTRLEELHREYPGKPILVSEFGGEADREIEWQIGRLKAGFEGITGPYVCGTVIWCWADHPWDKTWLEPPLSPYGVFTRDRRARPSVEIAREGFINRQRQFEARTK